MILTPLNAVVYRVHQPKWAFAPISGAGAGSHGGRANRPGVNALYLSLQLETALAEYQQLDALLPPGLMVSYKLSLDVIVDFRGGFTSEWGRALARLLLRLAQYALQPRNRTPFLGDWGSGPRCGREGHPV